MGMPFNPEEIDDLDESLLETMDREELSDFRDDLQETLDQMMTLEPDPDKDEDAYYEWQDRINVLNDMIDAIDSRMGVKDDTLLLFQHSLSNITTALQKRV